MFDATITLGTLVQTAALGGGIIIYIITMKNKVSGLVGDIKDIKDDLKALNKLTTQLAVNNSRLDNLEQDIRELKHGNGFILPLVNKS